MSENNQPNKQIENEKDNKDGEESEESEESEEIEKSEENKESEENEENENEEEEKEKIDFNIPLRDKTDYSFRPRKLKPEPAPKIYGDEWRFRDNVSDELSDSDVNSEFDLGDEIQTFNYKKLRKLKPYQGRKRMFEESEGEDSYTDSLEEGDFERCLEYVFPDVDGDNETTITQKEIDWYDGWNKYHIWDEDKKEYNSNGRRVKKDFAGYSQEQIQRAEARKKREHNLKRKQLYL
jgi:hypothetical protein